MRNVDGRAGRRYIVLGIVTGLAAILALWQTRVGLGARGAVEAAAGFLGVGAGQLTVVRGPRNVEGADGQKLVELTVEYAQPGRAEKTRAVFQVDARAGTVRRVIWPDLFSEAGPPTNPLPKGKLQAIVAAFLKAHSPLPGTEPRLEKASPFPAGKGTHYMFQWTFAQAKDAIPLGRVMLTVHSASGQVSSYSYEPVDAPALGRAKVSREEAVRIAAHEAPQVWTNQQLLLHHASLLSRDPDGRRGRPVWLVGYVILQPGGASEDAVFGVPWQIYIDAVTGKVVRKDR